MSKRDQPSAFNLQGRFLRFELEDGYKIKRLLVATVEGECWIKLSKEARASVGGILTPGDWIQVRGERTISSKTAEVKLKAYRISPASPGQNSSDPSLSGQSQVKAPPAIPSKPKASILVCQKSDCMKRGGKAVCKALEATLDDRGLTDEVAIRGTGCMKNCKAGPNIVFMPDKSHYSRIKAGDIPALVDEHFPQPIPTNPQTLPSTSNLSEPQPAQLDHQTVSRSR